MIAAARCNGRAEVIEKLSSAIDMNPDLPGGVFRRSGLKFWFFERPVLVNQVAIRDIIEESYNSYKADIFVKYSRSSDADSCLIFDSSCAEDSAGGIFESHGDFLVKFGCPIVFGDCAGTWFAFESAHEEIGVLGVAQSGVSNSFISLLEDGFINPDRLRSLARNDDRWDGIARAFLASYG